MSIRNISKKSILCKKIKLITSVFGKALGLMFSFPIKDIGYVFVFDTERKTDLHMFFVFYPIDVLFLDKGKKVVETKESFRPFTFYSSKNKASFIIELPVGTVKKSRTSVGDILELG